MTMPQTYACIPSCLKCRTAGECDKSYAPRAPMLAALVAPEGGTDGITLDRDEWSPERAPRDPHAGQIRLPCGCLGLPWPVVQAFGSHIEEIYCERHGWLVLPPKKKEKLRRDAHRAKQAEAGDLFDEIPF